MAIWAGPHKVGSSGPSVVGRGGVGCMNQLQPICILLVATSRCLTDQNTQQAVCICAGKHMLRCKPQALALNCNCTRLSIIDFHGVLSFYDLRAPPLQPGAQGGGVPTAGEHLAAERKVLKLGCLACAPMSAFSMLVLQHTQLPQPCISCR